MGQNKSSAAASSKFSAILLVALNTTHGRYSAEITQAIRACRHSARHHRRILGLRCAWVLIAHRALS